MISGNSSNATTHHMFSFGRDTAMNHNAFTALRDNANMNLGETYINLNRYGAGGSKTSTVTTNGRLSSTAGFTTNPTSDIRNFTDNAEIAIGGRPDGGFYN